MAGDFNKPVVTDNYALVYTLMIVENMKALAQGLDPAVVNPANLPINTIRWNSVNKHDEIFTGATWVEKCDVYSISISGSAGYATTAGTAGTANALNNGLNYSVHSVITFNNGGVGTGYMVSNEPTWGFLHRPSVNGTTAAHAWTNAAGTVIGYMTSAGAMAVSSVTSTTHIAFGSGGTSAAGTIYSDANWGCVFRAKQASPTIADFEFQTSAGVTALRIDSSNAYFTTQRTVHAGGLVINNGIADGGQLTFSSAGYSDWNIDNAYGGFRLMNNTVPGVVALSIAATTGNASFVGAISGAAISGTTITASSVVRGNASTGVTTASAVVGVATTGNAIYGANSSSTNDTIYAVNSSGTVGKSAIKGWGSNNAGGVHGLSQNAIGVIGESVAGYGVMAYSTSNVGLYCESASTAPPLKIVTKASAPTTNLSDGCFYTSTTGQPYVRISGVWRSINVT